jgi:GNAT superfamily N-acetyltransferase
MEHEITVRRALPGDAAWVVTMRIRGTRERRNAEQEVEAFRAVAEERFARGIASGELRIWLAFAGERPIGTATLMLLPNLPRLGAFAGGADARVRNVFVDPEYRRRGIAARMMREIIDEAKRAGVDRLTLGTSVMGRALYEGLGFVPKDDELIYEPEGNVAPP